MQGKGYNVCFDRLASKNLHLICLSANNLLSKIAEARPLNRNSLSYLCMHYENKHNFSFQFKSHCSYLQLLEALQDNLAERHQLQKLAGKSIRE